MLEIHYGIQEWEDGLVPYSNARSLITKAVQLDGDWW